MQHLLLTSPLLFSPSDKLRMKRIEASYALSDVPAAFAASKGGHVVGKLVINVTNTTAV